MNGGNRTSVSNIVSGVVFSDQNLDTGGELVVGAVGRRQNVFTRDNTATTPGGRLSCCYKSNLNTNRKKIQLDFN